MPALPPSPSVHHWSSPPGGLLNKILHWLSTTQQFIDPHPVVRPLPSGGHMKVEETGHYKKSKKKKKNLHRSQTQKYKSSAEWLTCPPGRAAKIKRVSNLDVYVLVCWDGGVVQRKSNVVCSQEQSNCCWIYAINMVCLFNGVRSRWSSLWKKTVVLKL